MKVEQNEQNEFHSLFMMGLGKALMVETYDSNAGNALFMPDENELNERNKYISNSYELAKKEKVEFTIQGVYPFAKDYLMDFSKNYRK